VAATKHCTGPGRPRKRARYAGELTRGLVGKKKGKKRVAEYKKVQKVLGEHQAARCARQDAARLAT